jgi:hypothetical protein
LRLEDHSSPRRNVFEPFVSFDQSYHPPPLYPIERENDLVPIEHSLQTFHRSLRVPAVFPQDASGVLNGANERILVGVIHNGSRKLDRNQDSSSGRWIRSGGALSQGRKVSDPSPVSGGPNDNLSGLD